MINIFGTTTPVHTGLVENNNYKALTINMGLKSDDRCHFV